MRIENLIRKWLKEADEYLEKGDTVQASEKYYKAMEEYIKYLSNVFNISVINEVKKRKRWSSELLFEAATELEDYKQGILKAWKYAWKLHTDGFHEISLSDDAVRIRGDYIRSFILSFL